MAAKKRIKGMGNQKVATLVIEAEFPSGMTRRYYQEILDEIWSQIG